MEHWAKVGACIVIILIGMSILSLFSGCSTYRGLKTDVHSISNPNWVEP